MLSTKTSARIFDLSRLYCTTIYHNVDGPCAINRFCNVQERALRERTTDDEQASIGKILASKTPPERFPSHIQWLFPLLNLDDQVKVTRLWMSLMPPPVFATIKQLIKKNVAENWVELARQIPELDK